jgi:beta-lactamase class D
MCRIFLFLILSFISISFVFGDSNCFIAKEGNIILKQEGECNKRYSPCSTFKIPLSLIGYNEKILIDLDHPKWTDKSGSASIRCEGSQTPATWIQKSCIWYSRVITHKLGMKKFKQYIDKFNYGNRNVSGDRGKRDGLISAWLSSSLKISPIEQANFIEKLINYKFPVSKTAHNNTMSILYVGDLQDGWKLFAKTGSGSLSDKGNKKVGWFVGYIKKGKRKIAFVQFLEGEIKGPGGFRARDIAKEKLASLVVKLPWK